MPHVYYPEGLREFKHLFYRIHVQFHPLILMRLLNIKLQHDDALFSKLTDQHADVSEALVQES